MLPILRPIETITPNAGALVLLVLAGICLLIAFRLVPRAVSALGELLEAAAAAAVVAVSACAALFFLTVALITLL
jgi:hypothetical protein